MHPSPLLDPLLWEHVVARQRALGVAHLRGTSVPRRPVVETARVEARTPTVAAVKRAAQEV